MSRDAKSVIFCITELQRMIASERRADRPEWAKLIRLRNLKRAYQLDIARALDDARICPARAAVTGRSQPVGR